jgi:hypothetical protein
MDPITIGLAFTAAQAAVSQIKQAVALGKDIHSLVGQFSKFFQSADTVHTASIKARISNIGKSDADLGRQALEFAMHSDKLREDERALKDMIYWQLGKPQIWEEMLKERNRLVKMRQAEERAVEEAKQKHKEKMGQIFMGALYFVGVAVVMFAVIMMSIQFYSMSQEQAELDAKRATALRIRREHQRAREQEQKKQTEAAVKNGA